MGFGDFLDGAIAPIAPGYALERKMNRARLAAAEIGLSQVRQYDAAARNRRTANWKRPASSADGENARGRDMLARSGHDLVRNNKNAQAGVRQMVAAVWGQGIRPQFHHDDPKIRQNSQDDWDRWSEGDVADGENFYGHGKLIIREMIVGGEAIQVWQPDDEGPNGRLVGLEGAFLDASKTRRLADGKIVQGVQFGADGRRSFYHLFQDHPNDLIMARSAVSKMVDAANVDHIFERQRLGQTRGVSWLGAVAMTLRDIDEIKDAKRLREKIQACLAVFITPGEGQGASPLATQTAPQGDDGTMQKEETLRPGMITRLQPGETMNSLNPTPSSDTVNFVKQELAEVSANMIPYHLMTGDVSQANYSGLRAAQNGSFALLDDWQGNTAIPKLVRPAAVRRLQRLHLLTGDKRYLQVKLNYALPQRRLVDPIKDLQGEILEIRSGLKTLETALRERGENVEDHLAAIKRMNKQLDDAGVALDSDPRKLTNSGVIQKPAGFVLANDDEE